MEISPKNTDLPKRRVMSRKGIGKLAGFGIANRVEVRTVRENQITHFAMDYEKIKRVEQDLSRYEVQFRASMAKRFTILSEMFRVKINGHFLDKQEQDFQFRFPQGKKAWDDTDIDGAGTVRYWFGFTPKPIRDEGARGVAVHCRGKLAQTPWFFDLKGGGYQSYGLQYLTGEIQADFLDRTDGEDLIATDRGSVRWNEPPADVLKKWAAEKLNQLIKNWYIGRTKEKQNRPIVKKYLDMADKLPKRQRDLYLTFVKKLTDIPQLDNDSEELDKLDELVQFGYNASTNQGFLDVIRQLNAVGDSDRKEIEKVFREWDIIEAINAAQLVRGRIEVVRAFEKMIESGAKEKPDLHNYLKQYCWLIDPTWDKLDDEKNLDNILAKHFAVEKSSNSNGRKRLDFFCKGDAGRLFVVEIKSAEHVCKSREELNQLEFYVDYLRKYESKNNDLRKPSRKIIQGFLIAADYDDKLSGAIERNAMDGIYVKKWTDLLRTAKYLHREFFELMRKRAPKDDPRIIDLKNIS